MNITIRQADICDIPFLVDTIIEAEKSGTDRIGLCTLFDITEQQARDYLAAILEEEIDGCEFSVSSFLLAFVDGNFASAVGGWIEGLNEDNLPSGILKANLLGYHLPAEKLQMMRDNSAIIEGIQIDRKLLSYQIEYVYSKEEYRGMGLVKKLLEQHVKRAKGCSEMFVQVFENNTSAILAYKKMGFELYQVYKSSDNRTIMYLPDNNKLLMLKKL